MKMPEIRSFLLATALSVAATSAAAQAGSTELQTLAEQTQFRQTGRYAEVQQLCAAFAKAYPKQVRCFEFGRTPEGRPMLGLAASADGLLDPSAVKAAGRPVVLMQGGIHAGEIDGKDAGFLALRELLEGRAAPGVLGRVTFVFVPVFNVDGHERFGAWNRPNQVGPEQMGWRVTAQNLNLNRDYVKSPELQREFARKLDSDREFAANPQARLDFFYRAHSSWDDAYNLYPVLQVDAAP